MIIHTLAKLNYVSKLKRKIILSYLIKGELLIFNLENHILDA